MNFAVSVVFNTMNRYRSSLFRGGCIWAVLLLIALWGSWPIGGRSAWFVVSVSLYYAIRLFYLSQLSEPKLVARLARKMKLKSDEISEFKQVMGLLVTRNDSEDSLLTRELRDRAISPWQPRIAKVCHRKVEMLVMISMQVMLLVIVLIKVGKNDPDLILPAQDDLPAWVMVENETPLEVSSIDDLASMVLKLQQTVENLPAKITDDQSLLQMTKINKLWAQIQQLIQAIAGSQASASAESVLVLQSATGLPLTDYSLLQRAQWRSSVEQILSQAIQNMARLGARFDGPGIQTWGNSMISKTQADVKASQGVYHEQLLTSKTNDTTSKRNLQQVPPLYRKAVSDFLQEAQTQPVLNK
ncbi:hypothetical protein JYU15_01145 [bacterium AH-315-I18]|nr:hypothetical protein [Phycisphaeraceae bacterium]MBN4061019.1 hypothetical protein [bacterium AH-315-I18]